MTRIEVDPVTRTLVAEPGAMNAAVKAAAAEHGLWYPPDPSSYEICSIGGNVATNAGGLCCVKYGVTTDYVLGLTVVLADGTAVELGGPRLKDVAGLSLTKLFVGSEGTLGIVTRVVLRLIPAQRPPATLVATFATLDDATATVLAITRRMRPSMLEFMDRPTINAVEDMTKMGLDREAAAMLVIQSDEPAEHAAVEIEQISDDLRASTPPPRSSPPTTPRRARRSSSPGATRSRRSSGPAPCCSRTSASRCPQLGALVDGIAAIAEANDVTIAVIAHAGDGNTHPLIVFDPSDADLTARAQAAYGEVMDAGHRARRHHHRRARRRPAQEALARATRSATTSSSSTAASRTPSIPRGSSTQEPSSE